MSDDPLLPPDDEDDGTPSVPAEEVESESEGSENPDRYHLRMSVLCEQCNAYMFFQYVDVSGEPMNPRHLDHHRSLMIALHDCPGEDVHPPMSYDSPLPWT